MSFLKNARIRTKILSVIIPLCIVGLGATALMAYRYKAADRVYAEFIAVDNATAIELWKANRSLMASAYAVYQILRHEVYDPGLRKGAIAFYKENVASIQSRFELARASLPARSQEIDGFEQRTREIVALTDRAVELSPAGRSYDAYQMLLKADGLILTLSKDLDVFLGKLQADIVSKSDDLAKETDTTIMGSLSTVAVVFALGLVAALVVAIRGITAPIARLRERMASLAAGETEAPVEDQDRRDELGQMAQAVRLFREHALAVRRLEEEKQEAARQAEADKRRALSELADRFAADVGSVVELVAGEVGRMNGAALQLAGAAGQVAEQSGTADRAAGQASGNVQAVAAAAEELSVSISEISQRVLQSSSVTGRAAEMAQQTNERVAELREAAGKVGTVVDMIQAIARQTNLLALNATIEASRAGEAGKGFAVVASEVKNLASQTARATEEIASQIASIQNETVKAAGAIQTIAGIIGEVNVISASIAAAVEEQSTATADITRHVLQAADGTRHVTHNIAEVVTAAGAVDRATAEVGRATQALSVQSDGLQHRVSLFLTELRA